MLVAWVSGNTQMNDYFSLWEEKSFEIPVNTKSITFKESTTSNELEIGSETKALIYKNQFGVNSNFRSGNSILNRTGLYEPFGSFRFPAGSGSNKYFWDCAVEEDFQIPVNGICSTSGNNFKPQDFIEFKENTKGEGTIVINYMYARYGKTIEGTRKARVEQAANYAAEFVKYMNVTNNGNIKFWEIGNECYGKWETGFDVNGSIVTGTEYGEDFKVFYDAMKAVDPNIEIGVVLWHKENEWNKEVLSETAELADFFIVHHYFHVSNQAELNEATFELAKDIDDAKILVEQYSDREYEDIPVAFTEFNIQGPNNTTMINGQFVVEALMTFVESGVFMSNIWVNEWKIEEHETKGLLSVDDPDQLDYSPRPSYTPFYYLNYFFGDKLKSNDWTGTDEIQSYTSEYSDGSVSAILVNYSATTQNVKIKHEEGDFVKSAFYMNSVYTENADNTNRKFYVNGVTSSTKQGGPVNLTDVPVYKGLYSSSQMIELPAYSVNYIVIKSGPLSTNTGQYQKLKIHPNPADEELIVEPINMDFIDYKVYDVYGRKLDLQAGEINAKKLNFNVSNLNKGAYVFQFIFYEGTVSKIWIKN